MDAGAQLKGPQNKARARQLYPGGITREQAETLLGADLIPRAASVCSLLQRAVDDNQFAALMALVFNIGAGNLAASTLLRKLNAGDLAGAADQFLAWDKARVDGVLQPLAGLTRRRKAERALFLGQDWRPVAATRGRQSLAVLPVPERPAEDRLLVAAPRKPAPKKAAAKKVPAKKVPVKKAQAQAVKPRARTTTPKAPPPAPKAARKAPRTAR
jgi:GH24 family phage-related lysozyme (muramidase)